MPKMFGLRPRPGPDPRHRLDAPKIIETAKNLAQDINLRLSGSNLAVLAQQMAVLAVATEERGRQARRPFLAIRALSGLAIILVLLGLWYLARHIHARWEFGTINNIFDALNTGFNLLVLLAGVLWFCVTLEARIKRKEALGFIEELREFAHAIDVTQLYYTPDLYRYHHEDQHNNPAIDETYLLYCTQMLGVISNLAPLYTRGATGDSILRAASEVQMLALAIITKHLAKAEAVRGMNKEIPRSVPQLRG
jgi:4-amino-4-deoxy-L-arabinose transferase-like glycosyltransferase